MRSGTKNFRKFLKSIRRDTSRGSAMWLSEKELKKLGYDQPGDDREFYGILGKSAIWLPRGVTNACFAPAGSGKTTTSVMPKLCSVPTSMFVNDTKRELYEVTAQYRRDRLGHEIRALDPNDHTSDQINPLDTLVEFLEASSPQAITFAEELAFQLYPDPPISDQNQFFRDGTRTVIIGVLLSIGATCTKKMTTLATAYRALANRDFLEELLQRALAEPSLHPGLKDRVHDLYNQAFSESGAQKTFEQYRLGAVQALSAYSAGGPLEWITARTTFNFKDMKSRKITCYQIVDLSNQKAYGRWAGLMQWYAIRELMSFNNNIPVRFLLDEACNSPLLRLPEYLTLTRSYGLTYDIYTQDHDDFGRVYGKFALKTVLSEANILQYPAPIRSDDTLESISKKLGEYSETSSSYSFGESGIQESKARVAKRLKATNELRQLNNDQVIIIASGLKPILARKVPIFAIDPWRTQIAENSIYNGGQRLDPVQIHIEPTQSKVTRRGRTPTGQTSLFWPIAKYLLGKIGIAPALLVTVAIFAGVSQYGFPHLRWSYQYSGSRNDPVYQWCHYVGPTSFTTRGPICPLILFRKTR